MSLPSTAAAARVKLPEEHDLIHPDKWTLNSQSKYSQDLLPVQPFLLR